MDEYEFLYRVITVFQGVDLQSELIFHADESTKTIQVYVDVSDTFDFATADSEQIKPEQLWVLEEAHKDLLAVTNGGMVDSPMTMLGELFVSRVRRQNIVYRIFNPKVKSLFEEAVTYLDDRSCSSLQEK